MRNASEIQQWLVAHLAALLRCPGHEVDVTSSFDRLGLDSATAVGVTLDLEDWLGRPVDLKVLYEYTTIQQLAAHLAGEPDQNTLPATDSGTSGGAS